MTAAVIDNAAKLVCAAIEELTQAIKQRELDS